MSHIVTVQTRVTDTVAVTAACQRLGLAPPTQGTARLFSGETSGLLVQFPDWRYPVVIDTTSGAVRFDDYGGAWGARADFDRFLQAYAVEVVRREARKKGYSVSEQTLQDGSIKVQILQGGS